MQSPATGSALATSRRPGLFPTVGGSYFALAVLFSMNLLNYIDRYSFYAVATHIKDMTPEEMKAAEAAFVASMQK